MVNSVSSVAVIVAVSVAIPDAPPLDTIEYHALHRATYGFKLAYGIPDLTERAALRANHHENSIGYAGNGQRIPDRQYGSRVKNQIIIAILDRTNQLGESLVQQKFARIGRNRTGRQDVQISIQDIHLINHVIKTLGAHQYLCQPSFSL